MAGPRGLSAGVMPGLLSSSICSRLQLPRLGSLVQTRGLLNPYHRPRRPFRLGMPVGETVYEDGGLRVEYNPPRSMPGVESTPRLFVPQEHRAQIPTTSKQARHLSMEGQEAPVLPPPVRPERLARRARERAEQKPISPEQVQEMQSLRNSDPAQWTASKLAARFGCSPLIVQILAPAPAAWVQQMEKKHAMRRLHWGPRKTRARQDRIKRLHLWQIGA